MEIIYNTLAAIKGYRTYVSAGATVLLAIAYTFFTWDLAGGAALIGLSAQAASLRAAINDFKKGVDEKLFGTD
jgi:hypothetical protein